MKIWIFILKRKISILFLRMEEGARLSFWNSIPKLNLRTHSSSTLSQFFHLSSFIELSSHFATSSFYSTTFRRLRNSLVTYRALNQDSSVVEEVSEKKSEWMFLAYELQDSHTHILSLGAKKSTHKNILGTTTSLPLLNLQWIYMHFIT